MRYDPVFKRVCSLSASRRIVYHETSGRLSDVFPIYSLSVTRLAFHP